MCKVINGKVVQVDSGDAGFCKILCNITVMIVACYSSVNRCLLFLCFQDLAFDLSLSALLGDNIYNFGELLAHPIVREVL